MPSRTSYQNNHQIKLDRALHHLQNLESETASWLEGQPYSFVHDLDPQSGEKLLAIELLDAVPSRFAAIIGDCLHNIRSALDNLVYELAVTYIGIDPLPERCARALEFPIFADRAMSSRECRSKIGCIHPNAQAFIKRSQPHERGDKAFRHLLWTLHELSNKDKHRFPHLGVLTPGTVPFLTPPHTPLLRPEPLWQPIENRAVIVRYFSPGEAYAEVDMQNPPTFFIAFGKGSPDAVYGYRVEAVLREIYNYVINKVVPPLTCYL